VGYALYDLGVTIMQLKGFMIFLETASIKEHETRDALQ